MLEKVYKQIDIEKISANENQPRTVFDDEKIEELAASIKENGLIQPIIVRKYNRGYQIVAGERRYRASKLAGLKTVPCVIKDIDDKQVNSLACKSDEKIFFSIKLKLCSFNQAITFRHD